MAALVQMVAFGFARPGRRFDVAAAHSVFTHLPLNDMVRWLLNVERALVPGGRFYASFLKNPAGKRNLEPNDQSDTTGHPVVSGFDRDPLHYDLETFRWICEGTKLVVEQIGDWGHRRNKRMLEFTRVTTGL